MLQLKTIGFLGKDIHQNPSQGHQILRDTIEGEIFRQVFGGAIERAKLLDLSFKCAMYVSPTANLPMDLQQTMPTH